MEWKAERPGTAPCTGASGEVVMPLDSLLSQYTDFIFGSKTDLPERRY